MVFVPDDLDRQRELTPVGDRLQGSVKLVPHPGRIGIFVDLAVPAQGFVDHGELPFDPNEWPSVGTISEFEVLQHRLGQIRLYPLDPQYRRPDRAPRYSDEDWTDLKAHYPIGAVVKGKIINAFP